MKTKKDVQKAFSKFVNVENKNNIVQNYIDSLKQLRKKFEGLEFFKTREVSNINRICRFTYACVWLRYCEKSVKYMHTSVTMHRWLAARCISCTMAKKLLCI
jgi:capsule polysaccharide export protein KpsE/RkpR